MNPKGDEDSVEAASTADGTLWLQGFLPEQLPEARVMLFGYSNGGGPRTSRKPSELAGGGKTRRAARLDTRPLADEDYRKTRKDL
ncbi:uncharacterized protein BCR38DRAFT_451853 [Pseudomassariella vexata]|uniref:Uncharacterized protein n=1 Tax=Pseudomassariella vexata TaxID=1141098 RepID=A0A1Y2D9G4_9PEZI|nr:uncharacterized protein BCR38DRAFT_451853 [Pseudomassariella vexata]ORY55902.1 hypothetical protein BCR38DRAFT_451853 [Pseudomassariella vexata]